MGRGICSKFEVRTGRKLIKRWLEVSVDVGAVIDAHCPMQRLRRLAYAVDDDVVVDSDVSVFIVGGDRRDISLPTSQRRRRH